MPLLQMYETVLTGQPYPIKALWIARHNFVNQNPDNNKVLKEIVPRMEFIVVADMFMNDSAQYADIVLPTCSFFEYLDVVQPIDQLLPYMQLQPKVIEPYYESRPDREIVNELGARMGLGKDFGLNAEQYIGLLLSSGHVSVEGITLDKLGKGPIEVPPYDVPVFRTSSGRIEFYSERMKEFGEELPVYKEPLESARQPLAKKYPLSYLTAHTKYGCHGSLDNVSWLRELDAQPLLEMNPLDAEERGITDGDIVVAFNDRGKVKLKAKIHQGIKPGVVNINQGWWRHHYAEGTHQALTHAVINPAQAAVFDPNSALFDVLVEVRKTGEG